MALRGRPDQEQPATAPVNYSRCMRQQAEDTLSRRRQHAYVSGTTFPNSPGRFGFINA